MELLIALLIAFGVTSNTEEAKALAQDSQKANFILTEKGYDQAKIEEYKQSDKFKESIIGLEESDM